MNVNIGVGEGIMIAAFVLSLLGISYKLGRLDSRKIDREEFEELRLRIDAERTAHNDALNAQRVLCSQSFSKKVSRIHERIDQLFTMARNGGITIKD